MLARVGQHSSQLWAWVVVELVSLAYWGYLPQVRGGVSSFMSMPSESVYPSLW